MGETRARLGDLLVSAGLVTQQQLDQALAVQTSDTRRLGEILIDQEAATEAQVSQVLSQQLSVPWVSLGHVVFERDLLELIPGELAYKHQVLPIYLRVVREFGKVLYVAMADPTQKLALQELAEHCGLPTRPMIASPSEIREALSSLYQAA